MIYNLSWSFTPSYFRLETFFYNYLVWVEINNQRSSKKNSKFSFVPSWSLVFHVVSEEEGCMEPYLGGGGVWVHRGRTWLGF